MTKSNNTSTGASRNAIAVSLAEADEIVRRRRKEMGKPLHDRPKAADLVHENLALIETMREAGYRQEDVVLLLLDVSDDAHKPDTLRKAIAASLGPWVQTNQEPATASTDEADVSGSAKDAPPTEEGPKELHAPARASFSEEDVL